MPVSNEPPTKSGNDSCNECPTPLAIRTVVWCLCGCVGLVLLSFIGLSLHLRSTTTTCVGTRLWAIELNEGGSDDWIPERSWAGKHWLRNCTLEDKGGAQNVTFPGEIWPTPTTPKLFVGQATLTRQATSLYNMTWTEAYVTFEVLASRDLWTTWTCLNPPESMRDVVSVRTMDEYRWSETQQVRGQGSNHLECAGSVRGEFLRSLTVSMATKIETTNTLIASSGTQFATACEISGIASDTPLVIGESLVFDINTRDQC